MLTVENMVKRFSGNGRSREKIALEGVSLELAQGDFFGLVGQSGAGKSTLARCVMGIQRPTSGRVLFRGREISSLPAKERPRVWQRMQMVWQDPHVYLNPHWRVGRLVAEPINNFLDLDKQAVQARVEELLAQVGLPPSTARVFPHQLSGGQCQRVAIARALAPGPELLICDEPVAALDLPWQHQIMELLKELRERKGLTILLITHDLGLTWHYCNRLAVMKQGRIVSQGRPTELLGSGKEPYVRELVESTPRLVWRG